MSMYEEHVRFMILGEHELCHVVATANNPEGHNSHLNIEQMNKVDTWHLAPCTHAWARSQQLPLSGRAAASPGRFDAVQGAGLLLRAHPDVMCTDFA